MHSRRRTGDCALSNSVGERSPDGRASDLGANGGEGAGSNDASGGHCDGCGFVLLMKRGELKRRRDGWTGGEVEEETRA